MTTKPTEIALLQSNISKDGEVLPAVVSADVYPMPIDATRLETIRTHFDLLTGPIDQRVFHPLLLSLKESDPFFYAEILRHPLLSGQEHKRKKKKRKERDRTSQEVKSQDVQSKDLKSAEAIVSSEAEQGSSHPPKDDAAPTVPKFQPDYSLPPMSPEEISENVSRVLARAISDSSLQSLLLAVKVAMCAVYGSPGNSKNVPSVDPSITYLPLGTHLYVLFGGPAPNNPEVAYQPPVTEASRSPRVSDVTLSRSRSSVAESSEKLEYLLSGTVPNAKTANMQSAFDPKDEATRDYAAASEAVMNDSEAVRSSNAEKQQPPLSETDFSTFVASMDDDDDALIAQAIALSLGSSGGFDSALPDGGSFSVNEEAGAGDAGTVTTNEAAHEMNVSLEDTVQRNSTNITESPIEKTTAGLSENSKKSDDVRGQAEDKVGNSNEAVSTSIVDPGVACVQTSSFEMKLDDKKETAKTTNLLHIAFAEDGRNLVSVEHALLAVLKKLEIACQQIVANPEIRSKLNSSDNATSSGSSSTENSKQNTSSSHLKAHASKSLSSVRPQQATFSLLQSILEQLREPFVCCESPYQRRADSPSFEDPLNEKSF